MTQQVQSKQQQQRGRNQETPEIFSHACERTDDGWKENESHESALNAISHSCMHRKLFIQTNV